MIFFKKAEKRIVLESYFQFLFKNRLSLKLKRNLCEFACYEKTQYSYSFSIRGETCCPHFSTITKEIYDKRKTFWYSFKFIVRLQNKAKKNNKRIFGKLPNLHSKAFEIMQKAYPNGIMKEFI